MLTTLPKKFLECLTELAVKNSLQIIPVESLKISKLSKAHFAARRWFPQNFVWNAYEDDEKVEAAAALVNCPTTKMISVIDIWISILIIYICSIMVC